MISEQSVFCGDPRQRSQAECEAWGDVLGGYPLFFQKDVLHDALQDALVGACAVLLGGHLGQDGNDEFVEVSAYRSSFAKEGESSLVQILPQMAARLMEEYPKARPVAWLRATGRAKQSLWPSVEELSLHRTFFPQAWQSFCVVVPQIMRFCCYRVATHEVQRHGFYVLKMSQPHQGDGDDG